MAEEIIDVKDIEFGSESKVLGTLKGINPYNDVLPSSCGAYVITFESGKRYIGSSKNVKIRMRSHKYKEDRIKNVDVYLTESYIDALHLESVLITWLKPELNKCTPKIITKDVEDERRYKIESFMRMYPIYIKELTEYSKKIIESKLEGKRLYIEVDKSAVFLAKNCRESRKSRELKSRESQNIKKDKLKKMLESKFVGNGMYIKMSKSDVFWAKEYIVR